MPSDSKSDIELRASYYQEFLHERSKIAEHKYLESMRQNHDVGWERALVSWVQDHRSGWKKSRARKQDTMEQHA